MRWLKRTVWQRSQTRWMILRSYATSGDTNFDDEK